MKLLLLQLFHVCDCFEISIAIYSVFTLHRNSFRNGTWPTSTNNLIAVFILTLVLMLVEPDATKSVNQFLWRTADAVFDPEGTCFTFSSGKLVR